MKADSKRRELLKLSCSVLALPLLSGAPYLIGQKAFAQGSGDDSLINLLKMIRFSNQRFRLALVGLPCSGSHSSAKMIEALVKGRGPEHVISYNDMAASDQLRKQIHAKKLGAIQSASFDEAISEIESDSQSAIFSFRRPQTENASAHVKKLLDMGFIFVVTNPASVADTAATWMIFDKIGSKFTTPNGGLEEVNSQIEIDSKYFRRFARIQSGLDTFTQAIKNQTTPMEISSDFPQLLAKYFSETRKPHIWKELELAKAPINYIKNGKSVLSRLQSKCVLS